VTEVEEVRAAMAGMYDRVCAELDRQERRLKCVLAVVFVLQTVGFAGLLELFSGN